MSEYESWRQDIMNGDLSIDEILNRWSGKIPMRVEVWGASQEEGKKVRVLKLIEEARKKAGL